MPIAQAHALRSVVKDWKVEFSIIEYIILKWIVAQDQYFIDGPTNHISPLNDLKILSFSLLRALLATVSQDFC